MHSWIDGQPATAVNLQNRGLAYGDGLFETIAVHGGQPSLLDGTCTPGTGLPAPGDRR
jgi:4-amino-4-deoxychorismate lyase